MNQMIPQQHTSATTTNAAPITAGFTSAAGFELLQRMSKMFSTSKLVPEVYRNNIGDCAIAINMAQRMNADPLMVMQNLYIVYGNPAWSSKFMIAMFNQCGRFSSIHYDASGKEGTDSWGCRAWAVELATGEKVTGPEVTIGLAKKEGWYDKKGSKWQTMPQQMLRYRAAAWFIRTTAPELSMGLQTREEAIDIESEEVPMQVARQEIHEEIQANANSEDLMPKALPQKKVEAVKAPEKVETQQEALPLDGPTF